MILACWKLENGCIQTFSCSPPIKEHTPLPTTILGHTAYTKRRLFKRALLIKSTSCERAAQGRFTPLLLRYRNLFGETSLSSSPPPTLVLVLRIFTMTRHSSHHIILIEFLRVIQKDVSALNRRWWHAAHLIWMTLVYSLLRVSFWYWMDETRFAALWTASNTLTLPNSPTISYIGCKTFAPLSNLQTH